MGSTILMQQSLSTEDKLGTGPYSEASLGGAGSLVPYTTEPLHKWWVLCRSFSTKERSFVPESTSDSLHAEVLLPLLTQARPRTTRQVAEELSTAIEQTTETQNLYKEKQLRRQVRLMVTYYFMM